MYSFHLQVAADKFEKKHKNELLFLKNIMKHYWGDPKGNWMSAFIHPGDPRSNNGYERCMNIQKELVTWYQLLLAI